MSVYSTLIDALSGIAPTAPNVYTGESSTYIVVRYAVEPAQFADNRPQCLAYAIQVHFFCPPRENRLGDRERIMRVLFDAGFGWPVETDLTDGDGQHYVYECSCVEGIPRG